MPLTPAQALYIMNNDLGCRYVTPADNIAYGFLDIEGNGENGGDVTPPMDVLFRWVTNPDQPPFEPRWHDRLWNTCGHIIARSANGTVALVTRAGAVYERRYFNSPLSRYDGYTFRQNHNLPVNSQVVANIPYGGNIGTAETVNRAILEALYDAILNELKKLAPGK